jgi:hypothetical protein
MQLSGIVNRVEEILIMSTRVGCLPAVLKSTAVLDS